MKKIMLIHGANLNGLGKRNSDYYGTLTLKEIETLTLKELNKFNYDMISYQSNHEGYLIDALQFHAENSHGIIINPGAFTHYSYALHDAILDTGLPAIEVHLSNVEQREEWRKKSVTSAACVCVISGKKEQGYIEAVNKLVSIIQ